MKIVTTNLFLLYFLLLSTGPLVYLGKIPLSSYHLVFMIILFIVGFNIIYKKQKLCVYLYLKIFITVMIFFTFLYSFKLFDPNYIHSLRDFIVIFSGLQYVVLTIIVLEIFKFKNLSFLVLKINIYIVPIMGLVAILQILNLFDVPNILLNFYSKIGAESRMEYLYWNPRSTATFNLEPNTFGLFMSFSLLMFHMFYKDLKINLIASVTIYLFGILGLLLSGSFTALIIYIVTTFIFFVLYKKIGIKFIIGLSLLIILLSTFFLEDIEKSIQRQKLSADNLIPSSLTHRVNDRWIKVIEDMLESPIVGIGPSAIELDYATDNEYLDKFLRFGLLGGIVFILFTIFLILYPLMKRKSTDDIFIKKLLMFSSLLALSFALASLTGTAFKAKRIAELFWIFYSIPFVNLYLIKKRNKNYV